MFNWNKKQTPLKGWHFTSKKSNKWILIKKEEAETAFTIENGFSKEDQEKILSMKAGETIEILDCSIKYGFIKSYFSFTEA